MSNLIRPISDIKGISTKNTYEIFDTLVTEKIVEQVDDSGNVVKTESGEVLTKPIKTVDFLIFNDENQWQYYPIGAFKPSSSKPLKKALKSGKK